MPNPRYKSFYKFCAITAVVMVIVFRRNFAAEMDAFSGFGIFPIPDEMPVNAVGWFAFLGQHPFSGLLLFNLVDLVNYFLSGIILLGVFTAVRKRSPGLALVGGLATWTAAGVFLASNQGFAMLSLSRQYAAADAASQPIFLAAGEALLAIDNPAALVSGTGDLAGRLLIALGGLLFSFAMLRSEHFGKLAAWSGIMANGFLLAYFIVLFLAPVWVALPYVLSAPFRVLWFVLIARDLWRLSSVSPSSNRSEV